jgi:hypothetical protein
MSLTSWTCPHRELSEPDQHGFAICLVCGGAIAVRLTRYILDRALGQVRGK